MNLKCCIQFISYGKKSKLCDFLKEIKVPDDFASNISQCSNVKERNIFGMKCHDHHIFLQHILPYISKGLLKKEICEPLIKLAIFSVNYVVRCCIHPN